MKMTREDLSIICAPLYAIAWALRLDISTPNFTESVEAKIAWVLTGIIAGLTPIVGPVVAAGIQAALGYKKNGGV